MGRYYRKRNLSRGIGDWDMRRACLPDLPTVNLGSVNLGFRKRSDFSS
jgi:hypothetical protein